MSFNKTILIKLLSGQISPLFTMSDNIVFRTKPDPSPVNAIFKAWNETPKKKRADFPYEHWQLELQKFVSATGYNRCFDLHNNKATSCQCMFGLDEESQSDTCFYLLDFAQKPKVERQAIVLDWMKYAEAMRRELELDGTQKQPRIYLLPGSTTHMICANACSRLVGFNRRAWTTVKKAYEKNEIPKHGLSGKPSNARKESYEKLLGDYFATLEGMATPRATVEVREMVGDKVDVSTREGEAIKELPTYMTKLGLYKKLLGECKVSYTFSNKNRRIEKQAKEDSIECPDWHTFLDYWKKNHPSLVIPRPREDICGDCHRFVNLHKSLKDAASGKKRKHDAVDDASAVDVLNEDDESSIPSLNLEQVDDGKRYSI